MTTQLPLFPMPAKPDLSWLPPYMYPAENYLTWGELIACVPGRETDIINHVLRYWKHRHTDAPFYRFALALKAGDFETVNQLRGELCQGAPVSVRYQTERSLLEIARRWETQV